MCSHITALVYNLCCILSSRRMQIEVWSIIGALSKLKKYMLIKYHLINLMLLITKYLNINSFTYLIYLMRMLGHVQQTQRLEPILNCMIINLTVYCIHILPTPLYNQGWSLLTILSFDGSNILQHKMLIFGSRCNRTLQMMPR